MKNLLKAIENFKRWEKLEYNNLNIDERNGEWETYYDEWNTIYTLYAHVLENCSAIYADTHQLDEMIYIIARDNECEWLIHKTVQYTDWFETLCRHCIQTNEGDAKWQFASQLPVCQCDRETKNLILVFAEDREEYVCRRALLAMPAIRPDKVECYAELFWNRKLYDDELQKYQKMAVLEALKKINSPLLSQYLEMAKVEEEKITN